MNAIPFPIDIASLEGFVDGRIAHHADLEPRGLRLTAGQKRVVAGFIVFMVISAAMWVAGFAAYRNEINARLDGNCAVVVKVRTALENVLVAATAPRSTATAGGDPARLQGILDLNRTLHQAREKYLPPIQALRCDDGS